MPVISIAMEGMAAAAWRDIVGVLRRLGRLRRRCSGGPSHRATAAGAADNAPGCGDVQSVGGLRICPPAAAQDRASSCSADAGQQAVRRVEQVGRRNGGFGGEIRGEPFATDQRPLPPPMSDACICTGAMSCFESRLV